MRGGARPNAAGRARAIQRRLRAVRGADTDRGVRQDSMHVLLGATMPAVLVEVGFIDHPVEGPELLEATTRGRLCDAIAAGVAADLER